VLRTVPIADILPFSQDGETYDPLDAYGQSNAARTIFALFLGEKLKGEGIRVFSVDPGGMYLAMKPPVENR
jgi:hypothetical protein